MKFLDLSCFGFGTLVLPDGKKTLLVGKWLVTTICQFDGFGDRYGITFALFCKNITYIII